MPKFIKVKRIFTFDAAHFLANHDGKCANMHGHTYKLEVMVSRPDYGLIEGGTSESMVVDFSLLNKIVQETVLDKVDHKVLNEVFSFRMTSENLACCFFDLLKEKFECCGLKLEKVVLWESSSSSVEIEE